MWSSEKATRASHFKASAAIAAAILAATVLALVAATTRPAEAAYPGANGDIAYTSGTFVTNLEIYRIEPDGSDPLNLTSDLNTSSENLPAWSSEGTWIAFVSNNNEQGGSTPRSGG